MPSKNFVLDDGLAVTIYKRRSSRNLRLSLSATGQIRVSIPAWAPYRSGLEFARSRSDWIRAQARRKVLLESGQPVGKAHHLEFIERSGIDKPASRIVGSSVKVYLPSLSDWRGPMAQTVAEAACIRALRLQAEKLLPQRLAALAAAHGYRFGQVSIKRLKGRWGSCDIHGNIVLNLFLMRLPWELIDYVLLHELTHTAVPRHGPPFWQAMTAKQPETARLREAIKTYAPAVTAAGQIYGIM